MIRLSVRKPRLLAAARAALAAVPEPLRRHASVKETPSGGLSLSVPGACASSRACVQRFVLALAREIDAGWGSEKKDVSAVIVRCLAALHAADGAGRAYVYDNGTTQDGRFRPWYRYEKRTARMNYYPPASAWQAAAPDVARLAAAWVAETPEPKSPDPALLGSGLGSALLDAVAESPMCRFLALGRHDDEVYWEAAWLLLPANHPVSWFELRNRLLSLCRALPDF